MKSGAVLRFMNISKD